MPKNVVRIIENSEKPFFGDGAGIIIPSVKPSAPTQQSDPPKQSPPAPPKE